MQAVAGHEIGLRTEDVAHDLLCADERDQAEAGLVRLEEEIDVALRPRVVAGRLSEQIEPTDAGTPQCFLVSTQPRERFPPFHPPTSDLSSTRPYSIARHAASASA